MSTFILVVTTSVAAFVARVVAKEIEKNGLGVFLQAVPAHCLDTAIALRAVVALGFRLVVVPLAALSRLAYTAGRGLASLSSDPLHTANVIVIWAWGCAASSILCVAESWCRFSVDGTGLSLPVAQAFVWLILLALVREIVQGVLSATTAALSPRHKQFLMLPS